MYILVMQYEYLDLHNGRMFFSTSFVDIYLFYYLVRDILVMVISFHYICVH